MEVNEIKIKDVSQEWLKMKRLSVKQSTYSRYCSIIKNHITPELGNFPLQQVNSSIINSYIYEKLANGNKKPGESSALAPKTVRDICLVLNSIIRYGEEEYRINRLAGNTVLPKKKQASRDVLSLKELRKIETYLWDHRSEARCTGLLLCIYTGMRLGEICALKWEDVDFQKKVIYITHTMQRITLPEEENEHKTCVIMDEPKSVSSFRIIPIPKAVYPAIKELRAGADKSSFFLTNSGKYVEPRNYQYFFKKILKKNEIREVNFHILRHTFASRCVEVGMDVKTLSEILGHSSTNITLSYYVHSSLESKRKQINLFKL